MGIHYSERKYYDDPEENERFIDVYGSGLYCKHGQASYYKCYRCEEEKRIHQESKYKKDRTAFWEYFRKLLGDEPNDNDVECCVYPSDRHDEFKPLKRSKSFEELKKEYYKLSRIHHPDKGGNVSIQQRLNNLYEKLRERFI